MTAMTAPAPLHPPAPPTKPAARKPGHPVVGAVLHAARQPGASEETKALAQRFLDRHPIYSALE